MGVSATTLLALHDLFALLTALVAISGICAALKMIARKRASLLGVPTLVWRSAVLWRGAVVIALFVSDACLRNADAPFWMAPDDTVGPRTFINHLSNWDGQWYLGLADHGYRELAKPPIEERGGQWMHVEPASSRRWHETAPPQWKEYGPYHFFPLYPVLLSGIRWFPVDGAIRAAVLNQILWILFAAALYSLAPAADIGREAVRLACIAPPVIFTLGGFSEPLFMALAGWGLASLQRDRRHAAAACALLVATTRIPGLLFAVPMAFHAWTRTRGSPRIARLLAAALAMLPSALGFALVLAFFRLTSGEWMPFLKAQVLGGYGLAPPWEVVREDLHDTFGCLVLLPVWVTLMALTWRGLRDLPREQSAFCIALLALHSLHKHTSLVRFAAEMFPLFIVAAIAMTRSTPERRELALYGCGLATATLGTMFVNGFWVG